MAAGLLATLYIIAMLSVFFSIICGGLLFWFRTAVFNQLKLTKLIKFGYIIARLKRNGKTEKEIVVIPNQETNSVKFPGVDGIYTIDSASCILKNGKFPVYEWREGETSPINHEKEIYTTKTKCPTCEGEIIVNMERVKSPSPSVINNLILKIKTLSQMLTIEKLMIYLLIGALVLAGLHGLNAFLTYDLSQRLPEILTPIVQQYCGNSLLSNATIII